MSNRKSPSSDQLEGDWIHLGKHRKKPSEMGWEGFEPSTFRLKGERY